MNQMRNPWLVRAVFAGAASLSGGALAGASPDEDKFRLLSCETHVAGHAGITERGRSLDWLQQFADGKDGSSFKVPGPIKLGKACLKNMTAQGGPGMLMIWGEICNARLDEFTEALAAIGTSVDKNVMTESGEPVPGAVLGKVSGNRQYFITDRMVDLRSGKPVQMSGQHAFMCGLTGSPQ